MTSREFCYWLQGFFELADTNALSDVQAIQIKAHLALVFKHEIDPSYEGASGASELNALHGGKSDVLIRC